MKTFLIHVSSNGWEYETLVKLKAKKCEKKDEYTMIVDGADELEIRFDEPVEIDEVDDSYKMWNED